MKKRKIISLASVLLLLVVLSACTKTEADEGGLVFVSTIKAKKTAVIGDLEYSGTLEGGKESYIATKISGQIKNIEVSIGDEVQKDQILARLTGEENFTSQNTAYNSYQNSMANLHSTSQVMDQKIKSAEANLESAQKNLLAIKTADKNQDSVSLDQINDAKLNLELLEINLENFDNTFAQKEKDILDSVDAGVNNAKILLSDILNYLYSVNNKNLPDSYDNFEIKHDFLVANTRNRDLAEHAILKFKKRFYESEDILSNNLSSNESSVLIKRNVAEELLNLAKAALESMNIVISDSVSSVNMGQNELDNYQNYITNYSMQVSNMLLSQDNGQAIGVIGVRQVFDNFQIEKENSRRELKKQIELARNGVVLLESSVKATEDSLSSEIAIAEAQVRQAEAGLEDAKKSKDLQEQAIKTQVDIARGNLSMAYVQTENTLLKAPYDGVVVEKLKEEGVIVDSGMPILKVADISFYKLVIYVPETEIKNIKIGQMASVMLESFPEEKIEAKVERIAPKIEKSSKKVRIELSLKSQEYFKIGMYATVKFSIEAEQVVLTLPKSSVHEVYGESFVYIMKEGKAEVRKIKTGKEIEDWIEVRGDIDEYDEVIIAGNSDLKVGDEIQVAK